MINQTENIISFKIITRHSNCFAQPQATQQASFQLNNNSARIISITTVFTQIISPCTHNVIIDHAISNWYDYKILDSRILAEGWASTVKALNFLSSWSSAAIFHISPLELASTLIISLQSLSLDSAWTTPLTSFFHSDDTGTFQHLIQTKTNWLRPNLGPSSLLFV